jgi:hypothetical protein
MSVFENMKAQHLAAESVRWDRALESIRNLLDCQNPEIRELLYRLLTLDDSSRFNVFGTNDPALHGYATSYARGVGLLEGVAHFINYSLLDDGEPCIGYMHYSEDKGAYLPCASTEPNALPYFHNCFGSRHEAFPDPEYLDAARALKVLDFYAAKREQDLEVYRDEEWLFEGLDKPTENEIQMQALVEDLLAVPE